MRHGWVVFFGILLLLWVYTVFKMTQITPGRRLWSAGVALMVFALMLSGQIVYRNHPDLETTWFKILFWAGSVTMGLWATYVLLSIPFDLANLVGALAAKIGAASGSLRGSGSGGDASSSGGAASAFRPGWPANWDRRILLGRWLPLGLLGASGLLTLVGTGEALAGPEVREITIPVDGLPEGLRGLRIAQISDLHVSPSIGRRYVEHVVELVKALRADLIVFTGDLPDGTPEALSDHVAPLGTLEAPLGKFYITGNHEYYWGARRWIEKARGLGFIPLINESRVVYHHSTPFVLGGVTDTSSHQFEEDQISDPQRALGNNKGAAPFKLLLAHRPESCFKAEEAGWTVQLSGHTHSGQFFPFSLLMPLAHRYYAGLRRHKSLWVYVNRGTGYWGPPNRFGIRSEITHLKLEVSS